MSTTKQHKQAARDLTPLPRSAPERSLDTLLTEAIGAVAADADLTLAERRWLKQLADQQPEGCP